MKRSDVEPRDEAFTHVNDTTGQQTTYAVTALTRYCEANFVLLPEPQSSDLLGLMSIDKTQVPVEAHHVAYCLANRGVEEHRLKRLYEGGPDVMKPLVFIRLPDDSMLLVDGTHRYILAHMLHLESVWAYFVPWEVGRTFILEDAKQVDPEVLMKSWSGF